MDLALRYSPQLDAYDIAVDAAAADLAHEDTLASAVLASLMSNRLAEPGDVPAGDDRRGWWADAFATSQGDRFGSRLWLLAREKQLPRTLERARAYVQEALQWMVDDGFATKVTPTVFAPRRGWLVAEVAIDLNGAARRYRFEWSEVDQVWRLAGESA